MRPIDADKLKKCVLKWLPKDPCGIAEKEMPFETDICVSMLMEIDDQPTIQPEPHWIPVTKQMPPINEDVLVSGDGYVWKDALLPRDESNVLEWYHDGTFRDDYAWQPLPEPYKKSEVAT